MTEDIRVSPKQLAFIVIASSVIGNSTGFLNVFSPSMRADAFTRTDWLNGKAELMEEIDLCQEMDEDSMDILRNRLTRLETKHE